MKEIEEIKQYYRHLFGTIGLMAGFGYLLSIVKRFFHSL